MVVAASDSDPVLYFHQVPGEPPNGTVTVTGAGVTFSLFGQTAIFPLIIPTVGQETVQLQLCADGTDVSLYEDCAQVGTSMPFPVTEYFNDAGAAIGLFRGALQSGPPSLVSQHY